MISKIPTTQTTKLEKLIDKYTFTSSSGQIVFWNDHIYPIEDFKRRANDIIQSEASRIALEAIDNLQAEDWKDDDTQLNITRHDFYQLIEGERNSIKALTAPEEGKHEPQQKPL